jgi:hypothetical protein
VLFQYVSHSPDYVMTGIPIVGISSSRARIPLAMAGDALAIGWQCDSADRWGVQSAEVNYIEEGR